MSSIGLDREHSAVMVCTVAMYVLEPFMADAVVARPWMHCQDHVAHGTSRLYHLVSVSTRFTQPRACGPRCVNCVESSTSWYNLYFYWHQHNLIVALSYHLIFIVAASEMVSKHCRVKSVANNQLRLWAIPSIAADVQLYSAAAKLLIVMKQDPLDLHQSIFCIP